ncbi:hypothetical protein DFH09DRAFT_1068452 [Mycena vulgaris]|nr:hypothetical protein DFH09DRAFT_1068452 [Mycena vulgaris]
MPLQGLEGSSLENPWSLDVRGELVLLGLNRATTGIPRGLRIYKGPPSAICQHTRGPAAEALRAAERSAGVTRSEPSIRRGRHQRRDDTPWMCSPSTARSPTRARAQCAVAYARRVTAPVLIVPVPRMSVASAAATTVRAARAGVQGGCRARRDSPLHEEDFWLDDVRPPTDGAPKDHHKCGICLDMKSHPVSGFQKFVRVLRNGGARFVLTIVYQCGAQLQRSTPRPNFL